MSSNVDFLGVGISQQHVPPIPRPQSASGAMQNASLPAPATSTGPRPHTSPTNEKGRLLASLPQGATAPTPPSVAIGSDLSLVQSPTTEARSPPIRQRNPNRPSSSKNNIVTVHVDGGPAAETSRPEGNEPPAYTPT